jgi:hypothetical protein
MNPLPSIHTSGVAAASAVRDSTDTFASVFISSPAVSSSRAVSARFNALIGAIASDALISFRLDKNKQIRRSAHKVTYK